MNSPVTRIAILTTLAILAAACQRNDFEATSTTQDQPCAITDADLGGFALLDPATSDSASHTLACLIAHADATLEKRPSHYSEAHMRWHIYAVLDGQRTPQTLASTLALVSKSEVVEAAAWVDQFFEIGGGARLDRYGCRILPAELASTYQQVRLDAVSQLCNRLRAGRPNPDDLNALLQTAPFDGCPSATTPGRPELKMLPAQLAAQVEGNRDAYICLLDNARASLSNDRIPVGEPLVVLAGGHLAGMLTEGEWSEVGQRVGDESVIEEAVEAAERTYDQVIASNGR